MDVCCLQETEVVFGVPENILNSGNYNLELENNSVKKRAGIYIHKDISYIRRNDLELPDILILVIDANAYKKIRIINFISMTVN